MIELITGSKATYFPDAHASARASQNTSSRREKREKKSRNLHLASLCSNLTIFFGEQQVVLRQLSQEGSISFRRWRFHH